MNNNYDIITLYTKDNKKINAELVNRFNINGIGSYVIYKIDNKLYGAKYKLNNNITYIETNLSDEEKNKLNDIFNKINGGNYV